MKANFKTYFSFALAISIAACSAQPTPALEIPAAPLSTMSMDDWLLATIHADEHPLSTPNLAGNYPDELVFANGFIWVRAVSGFLLQVDPATNTMINAVKTDTTNNPQHYCQGLGTDGKDVWVCSAAGDEHLGPIDIVRVDTSTQSVIATFKVDKVFDQFFMPFAHNEIWAITGDGSKLVGIDVSTNQANPAIDLGAHCFQLAALDDLLYATCPVDELVLKIDPRKRKVVAQQTLERYPKFISTASNGIWVSQKNSITRLDPKTLNPIVVITGITESGIYATVDAVWVWESWTGVLYKIDPATNEVSEVIKPEKPFRNGGEVLATPDALWLTANGDKLLIRLALQ